jgi:hypothetical protein
MTRTTIRVVAVLFGLGLLSATIALAYAASRFAEGTPLEPVSALAVILAAVWLLSEINARLNHHPNGDNDTPRAS